MGGLKFLVGFAFLLSLASLTGNWFLYERLQTEQAMREGLESQVVQLEERSAHLESLEAQLNKYREETDRLRNQIKDYVNQRDTLRKELDQAYQEAGGLRKRVKELETERVTLTEQVSQGEVKERAIVEEAAKLPRPQAAPKPSLSPPAVSRPTKPEPQPSKPTPEKADPRPHQILSVNRQFNFVVVNVGIRDRVKIGDTLRVEQSGKLIGRIQVEKLYENFSACTVLEEIRPHRIQEGDLVRLA